jgi:hypothetical protein
VSLSWSSLSEGNSFLSWMFYVVLMSFNGDELAIDLFDSNALVLDGLQMRTFRLRTAVCGGNFQKPCKQFQ